MEEFRGIATERAYESPLNPRRHFDETKIAELAESIKGVGIIEPLVVRQQKGGKSHESFEIIAGSRRHRAAKLAELSLIPVLVRDLDDAQALEIMVVENNQRDDVNALEEAEGYERLLKTSYTLERLANKIGKSHKYIYDRLKLLQLIPEAKTIVLSERMTAGHAILLARLKPDDQKRAINIDTGGLFEEEHTLFDEDPDVGASKLPKAEQKYFGYKARSVRQLEAWIDEHVRFDRNAPIVQDLFPETAAAVTDAKEMKLKVIQITHDHYVQPDAKEGNQERIYTERSWKLADGSGKEAKTCEKSVTGVVVIGPERGRAMKVCVHKECPVHWAKEKRERERRAKMSATAAATRQSREAEKREAEYQRQRQRQEAWQKATPAIIKATAEKVKAAKYGQLAQAIDRALLPRYSKQARDLLGRASNPEKLLAVVALTMLVEEIGHYWDAAQRFAPYAKILGLDLKPLLEPEEVKPAQTSAREQVTKSNGKEEEASMATKPKKKARKKKSASKKKDEAQQTA